MENGTLSKIIEKGFESLGRRLDLIEKRVDSIVQRVDSIVQRVGSLVQRVDVLAKRFDFIEAKIETIEKKNEAFSLELKELRRFTEKRFDDLCIKITFLENEIYKIGTVINYNEQYENMKRLD